MLSIRGQKNVSDLSTPWKYVPKVVPYDPETNPSGPISFATAENARVQPEIAAFANKVTIPPQAFRYPYCYLPPLNKAVATHVNEYFNPFTPVQEEEVRVIAAATALHHVLAYSLAEPGDAILTSKPYYGRFEIDFAYEAGVSVVAAETDHEECFEEKVVEKFEDALRRSKEGGVQVKCVLLVNPHNPLGRCYPRSTLVAIMRFCAKHSLHLISDEIYALSVFSNPSAPDAPPFTSILSIDTTDIINPNLVHATYGFSKDFGAAGLKLGVLISRNESLRQAVQAVIRFHGASGPSLAIATAMLEDRTWCREYVAIARERIADAYRYTTKRLNEMGVKYLEGGNAGFFLWINLTPLLPPESAGVSDDEREYALATRFLEGGVVLQPGEEHSVWKGWFRIVFTMEQWMLEEGLRRFEAVVRDLKW